MVLLVIWSLWKERNRCVYDRVALLPVAIAPLILEEARCSDLSGSNPLFVRLLLVGQGPGPLLLLSVVCCLTCFFAKTLYQTSHFLN
jgi:hypothetical protein